MKNTNYYCYEILDTLNNNRLEFTDYRRDAFTTWGSLMKTPDYRRYQMNIYSPKFTSDDYNTEYLKLGKPVSVIAFKHL